MKTIYGLIFNLPDQRKIIDEHCFGDCGRIVMGCINDPQLGELAPCMAPSAECPYLDKELPDFGTVPDGDDAASVTLRKLQPVRRDVPVKGGEK